MVWDHGSKSKVRKVDSGLLAFWIVPSLFSVASEPVTDEDVGKWPYSVSILVVFTASLSTIRWQEGLNDMGKFGVSYVEILVIFEKWAGHRLLPEKTVPIDAGLVEQFPLMFLLSLKG